MHPFLLQNETNVHCCLKFSVCILNSGKHDWYEILGVDIVNISIRIILYNNNPFDNVRTIFIPNANSRVANLYCLYCKEVR